MSRIGKQPVKVPAGVKVAVQDRVVTVQGPGGTLKLSHRPDVAVAWDAASQSVKVSIDDSRMEDRVALACWGSTRAHIRNMVEGVTKGYSKSLEVVGVGYTAAVQGQNLKLVVGFANPVMVPIPAGVKVAVDKQIITVSGPDRQAVGQFAAQARSVRKPEPYNGKGIKYTTETVRRKQGKQLGA